MEQNCNSFNTIHESILSIDPFFDRGEDVNLMVVALGMQFEQIAQSQWSKEELRQFFKDNNALDFIQYNVDLVNLVKEVESIQKAIIEFFGE